jgi:hypothetical protein
MLKIMFRLLLITATALPFHFASAGTEVEVSTVRPGMDYRKYDKFLIRPLEVSDTRIIPPPWAEGAAARPRAWDISDKNEAFLQEQYHSAMKKQLEEIGGYTLVSEPEEGTLAVEVEIISLTPWASRDEQVITKGSGEMTFRAEVRDAMTREILVIYEGDTPVGEDYQEHTEFTVKQNADALFETWGEFLRLALDQAKQG